MEVVVGMAPVEEPEGALDDEAEEPDGEDPAALRGDATPCGCGT